MASQGSRIALLEAEPGLAQFMSAQERIAASRVSAPVALIPRGPVDVPRVLGAAGAFGALVLDGMLFSHHRVGEHAALRLLGPGDLLTLPGPGRPAILSGAAVSAAAPTTVVLLGNEVLLAAHRWPRFVAGFHACFCEQSERLAAQLTICQLSRVDERLLAMMWLLADSWGRVTSAGTRLPLNLTHDALGALIGARRPTVTLALGELVQRGAIVRQEPGWLLLEAIAEPPEAPRMSLEDDVLTASSSSLWEVPGSARVGGDDLHAQLQATFERLRSEHLASRERIRQRLERMAADRARYSEARRRIVEDAVKRRGAPS